MGIIPTDQIHRLGLQSLVRPDVGGRFDDFRPSNGFGAGSLVDALRNQTTRLDNLKDSVGEKPVGGNRDEGSSIVLAQAGPGFALDPFGTPDGYDHVESVKNPDIPIADPTNPGNYFDPFGVDPTPGLEAAIFDALVAREQQQGGSSEPPVRTSTFGSMTISEGDGRTSTTDSTTGTTVTYTTNEAGERTTTVSTPQLSGGASPRTNVTYTEHADGRVTRQESVTSPTGGTYTVEPEPEPEPAPRREPRRSNFESDGSQSNGVGSDFSSSDGDPDAGYASPF